MNRPNRVELALVPGSGDTTQAIPALLSLGQAAASLGISPHSLRKYIARGALPRVKLQRRVLVDPEDLRAFIKRHRETRGPFSGG